MELKKQREVKFVAWLMILFSLYRPVENVFFWFAASRQGGFSWPMLGSYFGFCPKFLFKIQLDCSCCGIMAVISLISSRLPFPLFFIPQTLFAVLKILMFLIPVFLLIGAMGVLRLKKKYLRILTITASVALLLNLIDIPLAFLFLQKVINIRHYTFVDHVIIMDLFRALYLLIVIQFFKRSSISPLFR